MSRSPTAPPPPKKTQSQPPTPEIPTAIKFWPKTSGDIDTARISWTESPTKTLTSERSTSTSTEKLVCMNISMQAAEGNFNRVGLRLYFHIRRIITTRIWISEISNHISAGGKQFAIVIYGVLGMS